MRAEVEKFLAKKEEETAQRKLKARQSHLVSLGIWDKEFSDENQYSSEYSNSSEDGKYYKKVAIDVSDEEYAKICEACQEKPDGCKNIVVTALKNVAIVIYAVAGIAGIIIGATLGAYGGFSFAGAFVTWISGLVFGTLILGFGEHIKLLQKISDKP